MRNTSRLIGALFLTGSLLSSVAVAAPNTPAAQAAQSSSGDTEYSKRLQRLEEQIVDLSAQIGTLESLTRGGGAGAGAAPADGTSAGGDESRVGQIEMEVRTLSAQVGDLVRRIQAIEQRSGMASPPAGERSDFAANNPAGAGRRAPAPTGDQGTGFVVGGDGSASTGSGAGGSGVQGSGGFSGSARVEPLPEPEPQPAPPPKKKKSGGFLGLFGGDEEETPPPPPPAPQNVQPRASGAGAGGSAPVRVAAASSGSAKTVYDTAYTALMQRNYREAAEGFDQFVQRYPTDPLAGSAHFWLGEASFTNGEYRKAADNFLKCATNYPQSEKAAESMLKLGISLKRLNEKDAACSSFNELAKRYPDASTILQRAETEKRRTGC